MSFFITGCDDEISLIVSLYYKSLEGSDSLPIRVNIANNSERERLHVADKCARICHLFKSNTYRYKSLDVVIILLC